VLAGVFRFVQLIPIRTAFFLPVSWGIGATFGGGWYRFAGAW
jgi:hypothetical protein